MAVADSHCNVTSELLDTKKCIEDENLQTLASPEEGSTKKKKKRKKKTEESYEEPQVEGPNPTLKKKKKNAQGAQPCDPSLSIGVEPDFTEKAEAGQSDANSNEGLCHKPLLDTPIPIDPLEGNAGTRTPNPNPTMKKKKKSVQVAQPCDPSMQIGVGPDVTKEEVALKSDANLNGDLCYKPLLDTPITIVPHDRKPETTAQDSNPPLQKKKKKSVHAAQPCNPSIPVGVEDVTKEGAGQIDANLNGDLCSKPLLDTPIPIVAQDENAGTTTQNPDPTPKKKKKSVQAAQACDPSVPVCVEASVTKEGAGQIVANLNGDLCSKPLLETPIPIVAQDENAGTTTQNTDPTPKKKKSVQGAQACDSLIPVGVEADVTKEGAGQIDANLNGDLCSKPLLDTPIAIIAQDENAGTTTQNPDPTPKKKKKKKSVQGSQACDPSVPVGVEACVTKEGAGQIDANLNGDLCSKPLLDTLIPIVAQDENAGTTTQNPDPIPKKKKKKSVHGAQASDPSIPVGVEPDVTKEGAGQIDANLNGDLCSKPLLDSPIPIVAQDENAGTTCQNPIPTPKKKKKKSVQGSQACDPSIQIGVEPNIMKEEGTQRSDADLNGDLCSKALLDTPIPIVQQDENAERTAQNVNPTFQKKKKNMPGAQQLQTCNQPDVPDPKPIEDTPRKKTRKKKNVLEFKGAEPVEFNNIENLGLSSLVPDLENKMKEGAEDDFEQSRVCPNPELAPPSNIAIPSDLKRKKRAQSIEANVEHPLAGSKPEFASPTCLPTPMNLEKKKEPESSEAHAQHPQPQPCSKYVPVVSGINEECPVPDPTPPEDTPQIKKSRKKKNVLKPLGAEPEPESKESNNTENLQQCPPDSEPKIKMKKESEDNAENFPVCPKPELAPMLGIPFPNDSDVKKGAEPTKARLEHPQVCLEPKLVPPTDLPTPINPGKKKVVEPSEVFAQPQPCSTPSAEPMDDPTTPVDQSRRKQKSKRGRVKIMCSEEKVENQGSPLHVDITLNQAPNQVQQNPATPICLQPAFLTDQTIPVDPANPIDTDQKMKKKKRKKQKEGEGPNNCKHDTKQPESPIQTSTCLIATPSIHPSIPMDPCPVIPICPAISTDPVQDMSKKKMKKKKKSELEIEGAEPIEQNDKLLEVPPEAAVQKSIYPIAATSIDPPIIPIGTALPVDTEISLDLGQKMTEKKRKKKKRSELTSVGAEPNEPIGMPPETPVQDSAYPIVAPSIDPIISVSAPPEDTTNPIDQGQKTSKKRRKRSELIREGAELNENDAEPPGTPVQRSLYPIAAPSIDTTIPTSQASPVDPEQMTKKKKKRKSALKNEGLESEKHNADPSTETSVQKTEDSTPSLDPTISTSQSTPLDPEQMTKKKKKRKSSLQNEVLESEKHNANPTTETPVQKTEDPAPSIESTIPTSQATPVDLELMTKKKKIRKNALKNEGLESEERNADPSTEPSVQKTEDSAPSIDPTISTSQSTPLDPEQMTKKKKKSKSSLKNEGLESEKHNANPTTETRVQKTEDPAPSIDPTIPTSQATPVETPVRKTGGPTTENSKRCQACRQMGHKFQQCPRLRNLSNNEEICFFCGEIGHSLGKCHVARAERAMFANCLFCHKDEHFSYNCPRNGHGIDPKVVAADGFINRTVEARGEPLAEV